MLNMQRRTIILSIIVISIIGALVGVLIWAFTAKPYCQGKKEVKNPISGPPPKGTPPPPPVTTGTDFKLAEKTLSDRVTTEIKGEWGAFMKEPARSGSHGALSLRDRLGMFPFLFPYNIGMSLVTKKKGKTSDPYEIISYFPNKLYKAIGDWGDNKGEMTPGSDGLKPYQDCRNLYKWAANIFGINYYNQFDFTDTSTGGCDEKSDCNFGDYKDGTCDLKHNTCGNSYFSECNVAISLTGDKNMPGTQKSWNDYVNAISPSKQFFPPERGVKDQFWGNYSPSPDLDILGNTALLVMAQAANTLSSWQDLQAVWKGTAKNVTTKGMIIPPLPSDVTSSSLKAYHKIALNDYIDPYHTVRKQIRSMVRTFTENPEISPLTFTKSKIWHCKDPLSLSKCYADCIKNGRSILYCLTDKDNIGDDAGGIFAKIVYGNGNLKTILGNQYGTARGIVQMYYMHNKSGCGGGDAKKCSNTNDDCTVNSKACDWQNCDMVEWFGNIHDAMVEFLDDVSSLEDYDKTCVNNLRNYINQNTVKFYGILAKDLVEDVLLVMRSTYGYSKACQTTIGKKILGDIGKMVPTSYAKFLKCT